MKLSGWLNPTKPAGSARTFRLDRVDLFDPDEPLMLLHDSAIKVAQDGRRDNVSKRMRYTVLAQLARQALMRFPEADLVECGCLFGHSTHMLAQLMQEAGHLGELHVFDSFEGLSAFNAQDFSTSTPDLASSKKRQKQFEADYEHVSTSLAKYPFVQIYKGWIPSRFAEIKERKISFASIDVDLYQPTLDSLSFVFPRLHSGGSIYFDDYGYNDFPGARQAVDEYLYGKSFNFFIRLPSGGAVLIK